MSRIVWVQGTQLTPHSSALAAADRATDRILLVESLPHIARGWDRFDADQQAAIRARAADVLDGILSGRL